MVEDSLSAAGGLQGASIKLFSLRVLRALRGSIFYLWISVSRRRRHVSPRYRLRVSVAISFFAACCELLPACWHA
jgi:hypothetical protein